MKSLVVIFFTFTIQHSPFPCPGFQSKSSISWALFSDFCLYTILSDRVPRWPHCWKRSIFTSGIQFRFQRFSPCWIRVGSCKRCNKVKEGSSLLFHWWLSCIHMSSSNIFLMRGLYLWQLWSALACLPEDLKAKLVDTPEKRSEFSCLDESVRSLSTTDALKLYYDGSTKDKSAENSANTAATQDRIRNHDNLEKYFGELQSLLIECPAIEVHQRIDQWLVPIIFLCASIVPYEY